jgi:hypothetical protein
MLTMQTTDQNPSHNGIVWLKLAVLYLMLGVGLGIAMGASENFTLRPVHAHVNLLGWTTLALAGLIYSVFPQAGGSKLAKVHFWLINLAMPVMLGALAYLLVTGDKAAVPLLAGSEVVAAVAIIAFAANLFLNLKPAAPAII